MAWACLFVRRLRCFGSNTLEEKRGTGKMEDKDFNQKLYERLVDVIGTEEDVHSRRDFFRIMDTINAFGDKDSISVSSGSLPEGFDIEGSDEDVTNILKNVHVIPFGTEVAKNEDNLKVFMEVDKEHKGYATLYLPWERGWRKKRVL